MSIPQFLISIILFVQSPMLLAATEQDGRWHIGIGDPTIWGWLTVGMYLLVIGRCYVKAKHHMRLAEPYRFWLLLGFFLLLLAINKQLDLQTLFTQLMRDAAVAHGWYEHRRQLQILFICSVGLAMLLALFTLRIALMDYWRSYQLVWLGLFSLFAFILIRAASFHHIDITIHESVMGLELNVLLENTALMLILLGTYRHGQLVHSSAGAQQPAPKAYQASNEGADVYCPRCDTKAMFKAAHGRLFKCKSCAHKYQVYVVG